MGGPQVAETESDTVAGNRGGGEQPVGDPWQAEEAEVLKKISRQNQSFRSVATFARQ